MTNAFISYAVCALKMLQKMRQSAQPDFWAVRMLQSDSHWPDFLKFLSGEFNAVRWNIPNLVNFGDSCNRRLLRESPNICHRKLWLIPWNRVLLAKLKLFQLVKKFSEFYITRIFITAFTRARHLPLPGAEIIPSTSPQHTSWRPILILSSYLRLYL